MKFYLQYAVVMLVTLHFLATPQNVVAQDQKSILVTGASTGFGRHLAESLATGSIAGTIASFPGFSAYSGSKHWIEAFTDSFAEEMKPLGVTVSVVEPGNYKSHIRRSSVSRRLEKVKATGGEMTDEMKEASEATAKCELSYKEPDEVTEAFMHALFDDKPLRRYMVVPNEEEQDMTIRTQVNELVQYPDS